MGGGGISRLGTSSNWKNKHTYEKNALQNVYLQFRDTLYTEMYQFPVHVL